MTSSTVRRWQDRVNFASWITVNVILSYLLLKRAGVEALPLVIVAVQWVSVAAGPLSRRLARAFRRDADVRDVSGLGWADSSLILSNFTLWVLWILIYF